MTGAAERRNALHNPNSVGAGPRLRWQPFLSIYFSSCSTQSLALSAAISIPGKMRNGLRVYLWIEISKCVPSKTKSPSSPGADEIEFFLLRQSFIYSGEVCRTCRSSVTTNALPPSGPHVESFRTFHRILSPCLCSCSHHMHLRCSEKHRLCSHPSS